MEPSSFLITSDLLATRRQRLLNFLIDLTVVYILGISAGATTAIVADMTNNYTMSAWIRNMDYSSKLLLLIPIYIVYYLVTEMYLSRSVGKYITKTLVVIQHGARPSPATIVKRTLCRLIPFEMFTFFNADTRGWHDRFSRTYVVKKHKFNSKRGHQPFYG